MDTSTEPTAPAGAGRLRSAIGARFGGLPRAFWIVFSGMIANRIGTMVVPFLVFFLGARGLSTELTGAIVIVLGFGGMFGPALGGLFADRIGPRATVIIGLAVTPLSLGALFGAPNLATLAIAAAMLGVTSTIYRPASSALVAEMVGPQLRVKAFSLLHWGFNIGTAVATGLAGYLAVRGYWLLFLIDGLTCLVYAVIVLVGIPRDRRTPAAERAHGTGYGVVVRDRLMVGYLLLSALGITVYTQTEFTLPLAIRLDGLSPSVYGVVGALNAVLVVVLQPVLFGWLSRLDRIGVLAASWVLIGAGVAGTGLADQLWQYAITVIVWSIGEVVNGVVAGSIVADLAPDEARGRYQGAFTWVWALARLAAPTTAVGLYNTVGPALLWWGCAIGGLLASAASIALGPAFERRFASNNEVTSKEETIA